MRHAAGELFQLIRAALEHCPVLLLDAPSAENGPQHQPGGDSREQHTERVHL